MMKAKPREEDQSVNIVLRSGMMTGTDKGKQPEEEGLVQKAPEKEAIFDLDRTKETLLEAKKSFLEISTSGIQDKM